MTSQKPTLVPKLSLEPSTSYLPAPKQRQFCNDDEFLLFVEQYDCQFVHEAELRPSTLDEAAQDCEDSTIQIIRMDQSNWRGEDVTEDVANAWLDLHEPEPEAETLLPEFVACSEAWLDYLDDFECRFGVSDDEDGL